MTIITNEVSAYARELFGPDVEIREYRHAPGRVTTIELCVPTQKYCISVPDGQMEDPWQVIAYLKDELTKVSRRHPLAPRVDAATIVNAIKDIRPRPLKPSETFTIVTEATDDIRKSIHTLTDTSGKQQHYNTKLSSQIVNLEDALCHRLQTLNQYVHHLHMTCAPPGTLHRKCRHSRWKWQGVGLLSWIATAVVTGLALTHTLLTQ